MTAAAAGLALSALLAGPVGLDGNAPQPEYAPGTPPIYGLLWLDIEPSTAQIALDGSEIDKSVWLISLPPGTHEIHVRNSGYKLYARQFSIAPGQNLELKLKLAPMASNAPVAPTGPVAPSSQ